MKITDELLAKRDRASFEAGFEAGRVLTDINQELLETLKECEEFFDDRADADHDGQRYVPNAHMKMLQLVQEAIAKAEGQ